ncbi:MAG: arylamine N-acetyltransferase [Nitrospiraceae bacterium]
MDVAAYLRRIDYAGPVAPSAQVLAAIHRAHTFCVPFENLDMHLGRTIALDADAWFDKIVARRRGGYCFELNGLFAELLVAVGFEVTHLAARVMLGDDMVRPRSHRLLRVRGDGREWLADVGFGGNGLIDPLPFEVDRVHQQGAERLHLREPEPGQYRLEAEIRGRWEGLYRFSREAQLPVDYLHANYYLSHAPESIFTQTRICTKPTADGRLILQDRRFTIRRNGVSERTTIHTRDEYAAVLRARFGLALDDDEIDRLYEGATAMPRPPSHEWDAE